MAPTAPFVLVLIGLVRAAYANAGLFPLLSAHQKPLQSPEKVCPEVPYKVYVYSSSPLVIYLEDFITAEEQAYLVKTTNGTFSRSPVTVPGKADGNAISSTRTSQSAYLPAVDAVSRCIGQRAMSFQALDMSIRHLEPIQLVSYRVGEQFTHHYDWLPDEAHRGVEMGGDRRSSFFAYVAASDDLTGGGTNFPVLDPPLGTQNTWCTSGRIDCHEPYENGVTFRPIVGNAVFWLNLNHDGTGDHRVFHAGLPVTSGWKLGMNIWTREGPISHGSRATTCPLRKDDVDGGEANV